MLLHSIYQTPSAVISLTAAEVDAIRNCAGMHYDGVCKQSAEVGGFLWGWKNVFEWAERENEPSSVRATFRECDTVLKILEMQCPKVDWAVRRSLSKFFWGVCETLNNSHAINQHEEA